MFDFLKKKRKTESVIEVTDKGITVTVNGNICLNNVSVPDAMRIFYALHFKLADRYRFETKRTGGHDGDPGTIRNDEVELDPEKIDCQEFGDDIDVKYDGRLIYSGKSIDASGVYFTLRQFIGEDSANKIITDPTGNYTIVLGQ